MKIPFSPPDISEKELSNVKEVFDSGWITTGPKTKLFEKNITAYCGSHRTVCLASATAALETTLRILGVGPGDEVITSAYTYTASASVIDHVGAKIVFVDVKKDSFLIDCDAVADAVTERTKVIIPVDIGGVMCDYDYLRKRLEEKRGSFRPSDNKYQQLFGRPIILADAAHSFGAQYHGKRSGVVADFSCFSFHAVKNLTTAEGGAVTWIKHDGLDDEDLYKQYMLMSLHGQSKDAFEKLRPGSWEYDIVIPGYKCNMTDITAAIGLAQLERFDGLMEKRKRFIRLYDELLLDTGIERLEHFGNEHEGNAHLYLARVPGADEQTRNEIIYRMADAGVACNVHFKPLPMHTAYKNLGFDIADYPNAYAQYANEISLPLNTRMSEEDVVYIADAFKRILAEIDITREK